jgi:ParB-like chromosome segregation protein Spo0J
MTVNDAFSVAIQQVRIAELRPSPDNPRTMSAGQMAALERSIAEFGLVDPIIARREDRTVIGGHQRLEVAKRLGMDTVPAIFLELTEPQARALNIALNKIHGDWDLEQLGDILAELRDLPDIDVTLTGFQAEELEDLLAELEAERGLPELEEMAGEADDVAAAQRAAPSGRAEPGQLWQLGEHRLLCGDSLQEGALTRLCGGLPAPLIVTDPPYGVEFTSTCQAGKAPIANDGTAEFLPFLERAMPVLRGTWPLGEPSTGSRPAGAANRCWRTRCWP